MKALIFHVIAIVPFTSALHSDAPLFNSFLRDKQTIPVKANPKDAPIFIAQGASLSDDERELGFTAAVDRAAMARSTFQIPNDNILTITMNLKKGQTAEKDKTVNIEAGSYKHILGEYGGVEFKYKGLEGERYNEDISYDFKNKKWNKYETLHEHWTGKKFAKNWPEPTYEEKKAGVYGERDDCNNYCKNHNIYYTIKYYIPSIVDSAKLKAYNGMIILSAHGNLAGDVVVDSKKINPSTFGNQIMRLLEDKNIKLKPKWIVLLACGVGQERIFQEQLAQATGAMVFGSKFVIARMGSEPQMEFNYNTLAASTDWSVKDDAYDGIGDQLPKGAVLCKKLRMEFTTTDKNKMKDEEESDPSNKNFELMNADQFYMTMAAPKDKSFDEAECIEAFPKFEDKSCENLRAQMQPPCCNARAANRNDQQLNKECCEERKVKVKESCKPDLCRKGFEFDDFCMSGK